VDYSITYPIVNVDASTLLQMPGLGKLDASMLVGKTIPVIAHGVLPRKDHQYIGGHFLYEHVLGMLDIPTSVFKDEETIIHRVRVRAISGDELTVQIISGLNLYRILADASSYKPLLVKPEPESTSDGNADGWFMEGVRVGILNLPS